MDGKTHASSATVKINHLAIPKGVKLLCEICQKTARLQCLNCRVTFYCGAAHQQEDWVGVHQRACPLLVPIRSPAPFFVQQVDRDRHRAQTRLRQEELLELCQAVASSKLAEGRHTEVLPAAQLALRCSRDLHGARGLQLVPAYLLLADAHIALGHGSQAVALLSQAEGLVLGQQDCGWVLRHQLHRSLGHAHVARGDLDTALLHLANDVYCASEAYGPESIMTYGGYFLMAQVFEQQGKTAIADSLYSEVVSTWHSHVSSLFEAHLQGAANATPPPEPPLGEAQRAEGDRVLRTILGGEEQASRQGPAQTALVAHALALLCYMGGDVNQAQRFGSKALETTRLVPDHHLTGPIQDLLKLLQSPDETTSSPAGPLTDSLAADAPSSPPPPITPDETTSSPTGPLSDSLAADPPSSSPPPPITPDETTSSPAGPLSDSLAADPPSSSPPPPITPDETTSSPTGPLSDSLAADPPSPPPPTHP